MGKGFFPDKQFSFNTPEDWENEMKEQLKVSLTKAIYTIELTGGSRIVEKPLYIAHLIAVEKKKRRDAE